MTPADQLDHMVCLAGKNVNTRILKDSRGIIREIVRSIHVGIEGTIRIDGLFCHRHRTDHAVAGKVAP